MAVSEGYEEVRGSIRVFRIDVFESREIAMVVMIMRDELLINIHHAAVISETHENVHFR